MPKGSHHDWSKDVGHGLAHLQDGIDKTLGWTFEKIRSVGDSKMPRKKKNDNKYVYDAKKTGKKMLSFLGGVGDAFYDKYGELKKDEE
tara:strand:- start:299 stop:562 length:264 start_codon:yes stop_codon:yes gene_type:complete